MKKHLHVIMIVNRNHTKGIVSSGLPVVFRVYFSRQISNGATDSTAGAASIGNNAIDDVWSKKNLMNCVTDGRKYRTGNIFIRFRFLYELYIIVWCCCLGWPIMQLISSKQPSRMRLESMERSRMESSSIRQRIRRPGFGRFAGLTFPITRNDKGDKGKRVATVNFNRYKRFHLCIELRRSYWVLASVWLLAPFLNIYY
jgi:hypothetical protein